MTCEAAEITIDGTTYVRKTGDAPVKIAILQRGWVYVGHWIGAVASLGEDAQHAGYGYGYGYGYGW